MLFCFAMLSDLKSYSLYTLWLHNNCVLGCVWTKYPHVVWNAARSVLVSGCTCILKVGCATACSREALYFKLQSPLQCMYYYEASISYNIKALIMIRGLIQIMIMIMEFLIPWHSRPNYCCCNHVIFFFIGPVRLCSNLNWNSSFGKCMLTNLRTYA